MDRSDARTELIDTGHEAVELARRWVIESADQPVDYAARLLSGVLAHPDGLEFTVRFVDGVIRPQDLNVAARTLARLARRDLSFLPPYFAAALKAAGPTAVAAPEIVVPATRRVFRQLVAAGLIDVDAQGHGGLRLSEDARPLLRGETTLHLRRDLRPSRRRRDSVRADARTGREIELSPRAQPRYEALRELRTELAREQNVPPYMIFSNATLRDIAEEDPNEMDELATISGVGAAKLERYGEAVLEALALVR